MGNVRYYTFPCCSHVYNTTLSSLLDKHAPIITKLTRRQSPSNPWFTPALHAFRSTVRHAEDLWKHTHSAVDWPSLSTTT